MTHTKDVTSEKSNQEFQVTMQGDSKKNLLDLSPSEVVFYVGGYPANFTVSKSQFKKRERPLPPCVSPG